MMRLSQPFSSSEGQVRIQRPTPDPLTFTPGNLGECGHIFDGGYLVISQSQLPGENLIGVM